MTAYLSGMPHGTSTSINHGRVNIVFEHDKLVFEHDDLMRPKKKERNVFLLLIKVPTMGQHNYTINQIYKTKQTFTLYNNCN